MSLEAAIKDAEAANAAGELVYQKIADKHGVDRSTLSRNHRRVSGSVEQKNINQQHLTPEEEAELVAYIDDLTEQHLPPTREMIQSFASSIAGKLVSESWVTRFINRHSDELTPRWTSAMAADRVAADSYDKYKLYYDMLRTKIEEYSIEPEHTYNMDEKGFMIGCIGKSKRIFSKSKWKEKKFKQMLHNGNREWITLIACVGASGVALPPGLIYSADSKKLQSNWVDEVDVKTHKLYVNVTYNGWSNNDAGLAWLQQVFDANTKHSARRKYRLLIVDGHGSHISRLFLKYCHQNKILLAIYPPHSTHTLQPLDVVLFAPLARAYAKELTARLFKSRGLLAVKKSDFFSLFWPAWVSTFTEDLIQKAFKVVGVYPFNPDAVLAKFAPHESDSNSSSVSSASYYSGSEWRRIDRILLRSVKDKTSKDARVLRHTLHHICISNQLLNQEVEGLVKSLAYKKKKEKRSKILDVQQHDKNPWGPSHFYSPRSFQEAKNRERIEKEMKHQEELEKAKMKELKHASKLYNERLAQQKREKAAKEKEERDERKAAERKAIDERKAERERKKQERIAQKAIQKPIKGKRKASTTAEPAAKRSRGAGGGAGSPTVHEQPLAPAPTLNTRGRKIQKPRKFW